MAILEHFDFTINRDHSSASLPRIPRPSWYVRAGLFCLHQEKGRLERFMADGWSTELSYRLDTIVSALDLLHGLALRERRAA